MVPWTCLWLEARKVPTSKIDQSARDEEVALIEAIQESDESEGNIGKHSKMALKRLPSSVYWQGLPESEQETLAIDLQIDLKPPHGSPQTMRK